MTRDPGRPAQGHSARRVLRARRGWGVLDRRDPEGGQEAGRGDLHELAAEPLDLLDEDLHRRRGDALEARLQERDRPLLPKDSRRGGRRQLCPGAMGAGAACGRRERRAASRQSVLVMRCRSVVRGTPSCWAARPRSSRMTSSAAMSCARSKRYSESVKPEMTAGASPLAAAGRSAEPGRREVDTIDHRRSVMSATRSITLASSRTLPGQR